MRRVTILSTNDGSRWATKRSSHKVGQYNSIFVYTLPVCIFKGSLFVSSPSTLFLSFLFASTFSQPRPKIGPAVHAFFNKCYHMPATTFQTYTNSATFFCLRGTHHRQTNVCVIIFVIFFFDVQPHSLQSSTRKLNCLTLVKFEGAYYTWHDGSVLFYPLAPGGQRIKTTFASLASIPEHADGNRDLSEAATHLAAGEVEENRETPELTVIGRPGSKSGEGYATEQDADTSLFEQRPAEKNNWRYNIRQLNQKHPLYGKGCIKTSKSRDNVKPTHQCTEKCTLGCARCSHSSSLSPGGKTLISYSMHPRLPLPAVYTFAVKYVFFPFLRLLISPILIIKFIIL